MKVALDSKISATITWIAGVVAFAVACVLPATFFVSNFQLQQAAIETETEFNARLASQVISANPALWRFQQLRLEEFLKRRPLQGDLETRRIIDLEGKVIAESVEAIAEPSIWRSRDILDAGVKVGEIQIGRSLRPLLYQTAGVGLVAAALGLCAFVAIGLLPLRALNRALADNTKLVEETKRAEEVQKFLKELSQDIASLNIDSLLRKLTEKVREFFKVDAADVRILEKGVWKVKGVSGIEPEKLQSDSTGTGRGRSGWIIQNRKPLLVPDIIKQMGFPGGESIRKAGIRGYVGVPLFSRGGEVIGILRLLSYEPRELGESEVDLLQQLANGAAIALTNARLYEETERRRREAVELARVARSLTATLDMGAVGERIVTSVRELFGVKASTLRLLQPDGSLRALASTGEAFATRSGEDVLVTGTGLASVAVAEGRPIWSADVLNEPRIRLTDQMRDYQLRSGDRSMIAVPLRAHETIIGSLGLADRTGRIYSDSEVELAQTFADQAALALENARLFEKTSSKSRELEGLTAITKEVTRLQKPDKLLPLILEQACRLLKAEGMGIRVVKGDELVRVAHTKAAEAAMIRPSIKVGESLSGRVVSEDRPIAVYDLVSDSRHIPEHNRSAVAAGIRSFLGVPLRSQDKVIGTLTIYTKEHRHFSQEEIDLVSAFADQAAIAIENSRLFEETAQRAQEQEALGAIATAVNQSLHLDELLKITLDKVLEATGRERISIRLKNPVTGEVTLVAHRGFSREEIEDLRRRVPHKASEQVFASGETLIIHSSAGADFGSLLPLSRSVAWIPIKARVNVVGVMGISATVQISFSPREVAFLGAIGNVIGVALENARLFQSTQQGLERVRALHEIDNAITSTLDLRTVLHVLMEKIDLVLPYSATTVRLFNEASGFLEPIACRNLNEKEWKADKWKGGRGIPNVVFESKAPWTVSNVQTDPSIKDTEFFRKHSLVSYLGVPLVVKAEILGVLGFYTREEHDFSAEEVEFLSTIAGQAAIAIHNSQLYEQLSATNRRREKLLKDLSGLYTALTPLAPAESVQAVMDGFIEMLMESTGAEMALIRLRNETRDGFIAAQRGFPEYYLNAVKIIKPGSAADVVFDTGEPIIAPDITMESRLKGKVQLQVGLRSCAMLPLKARGEVRGIIHLASREVGYFNESQKDHLIAIARQIGIMLENRELFDAVTASRDRLEMVNETLVRQTEELARSNADLEQFAYVASHDLQEPLRMITGYTQLLAKRYGDKLDQNANEYIAYAVEGAKRMQRLIHDLLDYSRVGTKGKEFAPADCQTIVTKTLRTLQPAIQESAATITHDSLPTVTGDAAQLTQLFQNLIANAIKYRDSKPPVVQVSCKQEGGHWLFSVRDNGIGIDPQYANRIFVIFQRLHGRDKYAGTGIGLAVCKKIVERHGGRIWVESELGDGATFHFTIPMNGERT